MASSTRAATAAGRFTIGPDGTLYVANHRDGGLFAVDQQGVVTNLHEFPWQTSHVAYLDGSLFVTSRGIFLIYRYDLATGEVELIAGNSHPGDMDAAASNRLSDAPTRSPLARMAPSISTTPTELPTARFTSEGSSTSPRAGRFTCQRTAPLCQSECGAGRS